MEGLASKQLMGQPWRVAFALQDDGWILRKAIVWHKPNPMPESATDRPTSSYEMVFLLAKQGRYFYDAEAIRSPVGESWKGRAPQALWATSITGNGSWVNTYGSAAVSQRPGRVDDPDAGPP